MENLNLKDYCFSTEGGRGSFSLFWTRAKRGKLPMKYVTVAAIWEELSILNGNERVKATPHFRKKENKIPRWVGVGGGRGWEWGINNFILNKYSCKYLTNWKIWKNTVDGISIIRRGECAAVVSAQKRENIDIYVRYKYMRITITNNKGITGVLLTFYHFTPFWRGYVVWWPIAQVFLRRVNPCVAVPCRPRCGPNWVPCQPGQRKQKRQQTCQ